jgi:hypothetical protein
MLIRGWKDESSVPSADQADLSRWDDDGGAGMMMVEL